MKLENKVFVVTGAGGGIGSELAYGLLQRGAKVVAVDVDKEKLETFKKQVNNDNLRIHPIDITDKDSVREFPSKVKEMFDSVEGLINCAGIIQPFVKVKDLDYEAIEKVMNVNFYGTLYMTKAFLPKLLERPEAHLANVSSMGGFLPVPGQSVYGASKAAVKLLTEGLYAELKDTNVHVSVVFPGATKTDISKNSGVEAPVGEEDSGDSDFPMLTAEQVANIILDGIEKNKKQIFTGKDSKFMNILYRLSPVYATSFIAKKMKSLLPN
jgi:short-subunit dehydrogenase